MTSAWRGSKITLHLAAVDVFGTTSASAATRRDGAA